MSWQSDSVSRPTFWPFTDQKRTRKRSDRQTTVFRHIKNNPTGNFEGLGLEPQHRTARKKGQRLRLGMDWHAPGPEDKASQLYTRAGYLINRSQFETVFWLTPNAVAIVRCVAPAEAIAKAWARFSAFLRPLAVPPKRPGVASTGLTALCLVGHVIARCPVNHTTWVSLRRFD